MFDDVDNARPKKDAATAAKNKNTTTVYIYIYHICIGQNHQTCLDIARLQSVCNAYGNNT